MDIKTYIAAAVIALTAACQKTETIDVPADETASASASAEPQLNDDGSVKVEQAN